MRILVSPPRILDFDLENRPLSYLGQDWTSAEVTGIAWSWVGNDEVSCLLLQKNGRFQNNEGRTLAAERALTMFRDILLSADLVTGHYIRKHDLPTFQSALIEYGIAPLHAIRTQDTQADMLKRKDLSASQENLADMFGLVEAKHHMTMSEWRKANRLQKDGMEATRKRVIDDVIQHKALRAEMLRRQLLRSPRMWSP